MMNEEEYIRMKMDVRKNPFRVPEGYFDSFADTLMQQLPEKRAKARVLPLRRLMYAAACMLVGVVSAVVWFNQTPSTTAEQQASSVSVATVDTYLDEAADYVMVDNQDIYACLSSDY